MKKTFKTVCGEYALKLEKTAHGITAWMEENGDYWYTVGYFKSDTAKHAAHMAVRQAAWEMEKEGLELEVSGLM